MRGKLILAAILVQLLVLGWMAGEREWIVRTAPEVWLRTAPVDPRDLFRGDYVTLAYDISNIPAGKLGPGLIAYLDDQSAAAHSRSQRREIVIYVSLEANAGTGPARISLADLTPPSSGVFIKGRVRTYGASSSSGLTGVSYGIDAYFIQQGKGYEIEQLRTNGFSNEVQTSMDMRVAVAHNGTAVLTGHRWGALGIGTRLQEDPESGRKMINITLQNTGTGPHAVVLPADLRTLHVQRMVGWNGTGIDATIPHPDPAPLTDADVRILQPGESVKVRIDPSKCLVETTESEKPTPLSELKDDYQYFRVVYTSPAVDESRGLRDASLITRDNLAGRQFGTHELNR
ncbi:MAG: GDYXXLXY domain-containing protein [Akkermansiaceae bacterium]|nr:GDYXXLXY domain-containing protein [Akkermansiaceae bacterium]MCF7733996.1 GDYXXLXY domain-containing protein [Akkermansiaceae bacterium]